MKKITKKFKNLQQTREDAEMLGEHEALFDSETLGLFKDSGRKDDAVLEAMLRMSTPLQFVYAYKKTGIIVSENGFQNMEPDDKKKYVTALEEYFLLEEEAKEKPQI